MSSCRHRQGMLLGIFLLLLRFANSNWVDPDTPDEFHSGTAHHKMDKRQYELVFSDEFDQEGRTFHDGTDPRWTAINKNDYTNEALHLYSHDNVVTTNGKLNITTERKVNTYKAFDEEKRKFYVGEKYIQSGMVQGWNKFCFVGGIVEYSAKLPGDPFTGGLWPALWLLGNLARATYVGSSEFVWPYSYNECDPKRRMSQEINACSHVGHYGLIPGQGRGSPEIDILEAMQGDTSKLPSTHIRRPYASMSLQVAPGVMTDRPVMGNLPDPRHWYNNLTYGNDTELNPFFYGVTLVHEPKSHTYQSDAISANAHLNRTNYQDFHKYRIEWEPPEQGVPESGYIYWYIDDEFRFGITGSTFDGVTDSEIPSEPMYLLMNTAVASSWGFPPCPEGCECESFECGNPDCDCALPEGYCDNFPAHFEIDYVRVWQAKNESKHVLGCSTPDRPTSLFIKGHAKRYMAEGDERPLKPVRRGGGSCSSDDDCGNSTNGRCSGNGRCLCARNFTGPHCLAHDGFYDHPWELNTVDYSPSVVYFPPGLIFGVFLLILGFALALARSIRKERIEVSYQKSLPSSSPSSHQRYENNKSGGTYGSMGGTISFAMNAKDTGYQQQTPSDYYTSQKKDGNVTYCVIDGRLVDQ